MEYDGKVNDFKYRFERIHKRIETIGHLQTTIRSVESRDRHIAERNYEKVWEANDSTLVDILSGTNWWNLTYSIPRALVHFLCNESAHHQRRKWAPTWPTEEPRPDRRATNRIPLITVVNTAKSLLQHDLLHTPPTFIFVFSQVNFWSMVNLAVMVFVLVLQVFLIRSLFDDKSLLNRQLNKLSAFSADWTTSFIDVA